MKRFLYLLTMVLLLMTLPLTAHGADTVASGTDEYGTNWTLDSDGLLTVYTDYYIDYSDEYSSLPQWMPYMDQIRSVVLKDEVTYITDFAFQGCANLTSVSAGTNIAHVGYSAFENCTSLVSITLPESVESIGHNAFRGCTSLAQVTTSGTIGSRAFENCTALTQVVLSENTDHIGSYAFSGCTKLETVTMPSTASYLGASAFYGCTSLKSIAVPEGISRLNGTTFSGCTSLTTVSLPDSLTSILSKDFYNCTSLLSIRIPDSVESIGSYAFEYCTSLTSATLPGKLTEIPQHLFDCCYSLQEITIPDSVTSIEMYAFNNCSSLTQVVIPNGVTSIGSGAFSGCSALTAVTIPNGISSIESNSFSYCSSLTEVVIPDSVTSIGSSAFSYCSSLTTVTVPSSVTSIGYNAFSSCNALTEISLPSGITSIEGSTFYGCSSLTSVTIPSGVTSIGSDAFRYCTGLTSISIPQGVTSIESSAFAGCSGLTQVSLPEGLTTLGKYAFQNCTSLTDITLPSTLTAIDEYTFRSCSNLTNVTIPSGVTSIGKYAFSSCRELTTVTIPGSVTDIGSYAFRYCSKLAEVTFEEGVTSIGSYMFYGISSLTHVTFPSTLRSIGDYAFYQCSALTALTFPGSLDTVGAYAFYQCDALTGVSIAGDALDIGNYAFYDCENLTSVTVQGRGSAIGNYAFACTPLTVLPIPQGVSTIGDMAFWGCDQVTRVDLPDSVTTLGNGAFETCRGLTSFHIPAGVSSIGDNTFALCENLAQITVDGQNQHFSALDGVLYNKDQTTLLLCPQGRAGAVVMPDTVTTLAEYAFDACTKVTDITISKSVTVIPLRCFTGCTSLTGIVIPDSVTTIGGSAFRECTSLTSIVIPDSVTSIDNYAFYGCTNLTSAVLPKSLTRIPAAMFYECSSLSELVIPEGVTTIDLEAFWECSRLTSIVIPDSVTSIAANTFAYCSGLRSITLSKNLTAIENGCFAYCSGLESVLLPDGVTSIGEKTFSYCSNLANITLPDSLTSIGNYAFYSCDNLTSLTVPASVTGIGNYAFRYCSDLCYILFQGHAPAIASSSFSGVTARAYYRQGDHTWTPEKRQNYGGSLTWIPTEMEDLSRYLQAPRLAITVYENMELSDAPADKYVLCEGASITYNDEPFVTSQNGIVVIPYFSGQTLTITKEGYVPRTISVDQLAISPQIHLQRLSGNTPIISSIWMDDLDLRNQSCSIDILSQKEFTLVADIYWGEYSQGSILLKQNNSEVYFTGNTLSLIFSQHFDVREPIYLIATDSAGHTAIRTLGILANTKSVDGIVFGITDSLSFKLPADMEPSILAGFEVGSELKYDVPVSISVENGKIYAAIGADLFSAEWDEDSRKITPQYFSQLYKNSVKEAANNISTSFDQVRDILVKPKGSFGFSADYTIWGYAEGCFDKEGNVVWLNGGVMIHPSVELTFDYAFAISIIPVYVELGISGEAKAQMNVIFDEACNGFTPEGEIHGEITAFGGTGIGIKGILYSGGVEGTLESDWWIYSGKDDRYKLTASWNAYTKVGVAFKEYKTTFDPIDKVVLVDSHPSPVPEAAAYSLDIYNTESYSTKDLSYLNSGSDFMANSEAAPMSLLPNANYLTLKTIQTNLYKESTPQYIAYPDGTALAVWPDALSSDINGIQLYYSYHNGSWWTTPAPVCSDGTMDYTPRLQLVDGKAWLVWQNATKAFQESDSLEDIAPYFDISVASFDPQSGFSVSTIVHEGMDMLPVVCGDEDNVYVVWLHNSKNNWFGNRGENSIVYCSNSGSGWSNCVTAYSGLNSVDSLAADYSNTLRIAYCMDADGSFDTLKDVYLYENGKRITTGSALEKNPQYFDHTLYWFSDGKLLSGKGASQDSAPQMDNCQIISGPNGKVLVYTTSNGLSSTLNASYYDEKNRQWCEAYELTDGETFIGAFSAAMGRNGTVYVLFNEQQVVGTYTDEEPYGASALMLVGLQPYCDLTMGQLIYSPDEYSAGHSMTIEFDLTNSGSQPVSAATVQVLDESGTVLSSTAVAETIVPGQTLRAQTNFQVAANASGQIIQVKVTPNRLYDVNPGDNSQTAELSFEDLAVASAILSQRADGTYVINTNVVNYGYHERSNITVELHSGSLDGAVADTVVIDTLTPLYPNPISFVLETVDADIYYVVITNSGDAFPGNDSDFVGVFRPHTSEPAGTITPTTNSVSLDEEIKINQYVSIEGFEGVDITAKGGLLVWYSPVAQEDATYENAEVIKAGLKARPNYENIYGQTTDGIAAKEYADEIYLRVYVEVADGVYVYGDLREYSVQDYCEIALAANYSAKLNNLCVAMLYYGAAAQQQFNYNTSDLANAPIVGKYDNVAWDPAMITALVPANTALKGSNDVKGTKSISIDGVLYSNFYFNPLESNSWTIVSGKLQVWSGVSGALTEENVSYEVALTNAAKGWGAQCEGVVAKKMGNTFYARAVLTDSEGQVHYSDVIPYNCEAYARDALNYQSEGTLAELVKAMVIYGDCALKYFNSK